MKRMLALLLIVCMALPLCACAKKTEAPAPTAAPVVETTPEPTPDPGAKIDEAAALFVSGQYAEAFERLKELEGSGSARVAALLGKIYYEGLAGREDAARGVSYLSQAAEGGVPSARSLVAEAYARGNGVRRDMDEAEKHYAQFVTDAEALAESDPDHAPSSAALAKCYAEGLGVSKNAARARSYADKAAAEGLTPFETVSLADLYAGEKLGSPDAAKADALYRAALDGLKALREAGNLKAEKLLGDYCLDGLGGLKQDYAKAMELYLDAGEKGCADAQAQVAYLYQNGLGVEADYDKAMDWNNRAAEQGNAQAMEQIGALYQAGLNVTQSMEEASRWYAKAKEAGSERAAALMEQTDITAVYNSHEAHA